MNTKNISEDKLRETISSQNEKNNNTQSVNLEKPPFLKD